jgi:hypothetical protein
MVMILLIFSINNNKNLTIQGRTAFDTAEVVPLGYNLP